MKDHDEKCANSKQRTKLPVPRKRIRNGPETATSAGEIEKADAALPGREAMRSPDATTEIRKASRAETMEETMQAVCEASGIRAERPATRIVSQMVQMQIWGQKNADDVETALGGLEMMVELKPSNVVEAMLSVQMVGVHEAALLFLKRATLEGQTLDGSDANANRATRLLRLFNEQLVAMARLKGKVGQQKVTVEHVNVYQGGQAIVGAVTAGKERSGEGESAL